ncbi:Protein fluG [Paramyrothecium foliicola]|nr:Protein fluG [Paramyrothecium foliicola]
MPSGKHYQDSDTLWDVIRATPIIDHHAHPLLKLDAIEKHPFLAIATEANGDAIEASRSGLPHFRAVNNLARILGCEATWEAVTEAVKQRRGSDYDAWVRRCLAGIETVLADDGLDNADNAEPYRYFDKFTRSSSKRIVRIEQLAAGIFEEIRIKTATVIPGDALEAAVAQFTAAIQANIADTEVVGFKSVICYRTGLAIPREPDEDKARAAFHEAFHTTGFAKINHPGLNEYLVHVLAREIERSSGAHKKPIQFHTGLGDNDLTLNKSSPSHLQEFVRKYPTVPIVLLHSGYPFARETGYLAAMYANVYADIGEVFPFLSRDGQEGVVRQTLELCPTSKILWSTDGHWFPETYVLAVDQMQEVLHTVLVDYVRKGDLSLLQASGLVRDVLFNNPNKLYDLGLSLKDVVPPADEAGRNVARTDDAQILSTFLQKNNGLKYLRIYFLDLTATPRVRLIPLRRVQATLDKDKELAVGVTKAALGMTQVDVPVTDVSPSGEYFLHADLGSLCLGPREGHAMTMGTFTERNGASVALCPRTLLKKTLEEADRLGLTFVLGFEIELVILKRGGEDKYETLNVDGHAWSASRTMEHPAAVTVLEEAVDKLADAGIYIEMLHPESATGQYEVVLPRAPALQAVDTLIFAREIISATCTAHGYRMTLHPKPYAMACGTAAHVHMSISSASGSEKRVYEPFYAGILKHLRAVSAFTYSSSVSYERVKDGCWAGGTWVTWGTQNREAPLRKVQDSHWELKSMDGLANPYLAMSAILLAGMSGITGKEKLLLGDCESDPASLSDTQRQELGITTKIPSSLSEALEALEDDHELKRLLGQQLVDRYIVTKKAEIELLEGMADGERRRWVIERY